MNKETGGPAFPSHGSMGEVAHEVLLRDYFAAKALQAIMAGRYPIMSEPDAEHKVAEAAYIQADAMLKAREL